MKRPQLITTTSLVIAFLFVYPDTLFGQDEYDDMYFSSSDRQTKTAKKKSKKKIQKEQNQYQPEYVKEYQNTNGNGYTYYSNDYPSDGYYEQDTVYVENDGYGQTPVVNNYYGNVYSNPATDPYYGSFGFGTSPFGWSFGISYGYGFGYPYTGWYDPFYSPYYSYCAYRWNYPYYGSYANGYYNGYYDGSYGYPYNLYDERYYHSSSGNIKRGGRYSRGSVLALNSDRLGRMSSIRPERGRASRLGFTPKGNSTKQIASNTQKKVNKRNSQSIPSNRNSIRADSRIIQNPAIANQGMAATRTIQKNHNAYKSRLKKVMSGATRQPTANRRKKVVVVQKPSANSKNIGNRISNNQSRTSNNNTSIGSVFKNSTGASRTSYTPGRSSSKPAGSSRSSSGSSRSKSSRSSSSRTKR